MYKGCEGGQVYIFSLQALVRVIHTSNSPVLSILSLGKYIYLGWLSTGNQFNLYNRTRHSYKYMLPIAGQTAWPIGLKFRGEKKSIFFYFFHGQRRAIQLIIKNCLPWKKRQLKLTLLMVLSFFFLNHSHNCNFFFIMLERY